MRWLLASTFLGAFAQTPFAQSGNTNPIRARLTDSAGVILGIVRDSTGTGVRAQLGIPLRKQFVTTDDSGRFRLVTAPGEFVLLARGLGMTRREDTLTLEQGRGLDLTIVMRRAAVIIESVCFKDCSVEPGPPAKVVGLEPPTVRRPPANSPHGQGSASPTVWVYDSRAFCPDSNPATWRNEPRGAPRLDERNIASVEVTKDPAVLNSYRCPIQPAAAILIRTKRPK